MNTELAAVIDTWRLAEEREPAEQIAEWLESLQARGLLRASTNAVLLGEQYHLGGAEDTRRMAEALHLTADDRVLDLACYVGGPARQLARDYGCRVVGVDSNEDAVAVARAFTRLSGLEDRVAFHCADAEAVPEPDGSFTIAWSQCSFPSDLHWLTEVHRLLAPGCRVAFTGLIRRSPASDQGLLSLEEAAERVRGVGFRVISAEDISESDLTYGWLPEMEKLRCREQHYRTRFGEAWVRKAYAELQIDTESWRSGREGNGRIVAAKETS
jgi:SAM-dependent methyltransferase